MVTRSPRGGLSTAEKLASLNPAARAEGERELAGQTSTQQSRTVSKARDIASRPGVTGTISPEQVAEETKAAQKRIREEKKAIEEAKAIEAAKPKPRGPLFRTPFEEIQERRAVTPVAARRERVTPVVEEEAPKEFGGIAIRAEPETGIIGGLFRKVSKLEFQRQFRVPETKPLKRQALAFEAAGLAAVGTVGFAVTRPIQFTKGIVTAVVHPIETARAITVKARIEPAALVGELAATAGIFKGVGVVAKAQPLRFRAAKVAIPGEVPTRVISVEAGARAQPLLFVSKRKIGVGVPKFELKGFEGEFPLETATQARIIERSLRVKEPLEAAKVRGIKGLVAETKAVTVKPARKLPRVTEALEAPRIEKVLEITKAEKGKLFGSFPQQAAVAKEFVRTVGDIDIKLPLPAEKIPAKTELFRRELARIPGPKLEIKPEFPGVVQVQKRGRLLKGIELKPSEGVLPGEELAPEKFLSLELTQRPQKIEGVLASRLSEQGLRKAASLGTLRKVEGKLVIGPKPKRAKDIADFFRVQETLVRKKLFPRRARARLERLKELFPEGAAEAFKIREPIKVELGREPSPRPLKPSRVPFVSPRISPRPSAAPSRLPSPSPRLSRSISKSIGPSVSPSVSPKLPSPSVSPSLKPSKSVSPSLRPSKSLSRFFSPSISPSVSRSLRPSVSPSISPVLRPGISKPISPALPFLPQLAPQVLITKKERKRPFRFAPSLVALEQRIVGPRPRVLTGIEVRRIPRI